MSRLRAIALACLVAGAFQAMHELAYAGAVDPGGVAFAIAAMAVELGALTFVWDARRRRDPAATWSLPWSAAIALGLGLAIELLAAAVPGSALHHVPIGVVAQIGLFDGLLALGLWALAIVVPSAVRDARTRALEADRLRAVAELERLRAHVQPHFLLNTLNTISGLVTSQPEQARELIAALGDLVRDSLADGAALHTIGDEIAWLRRYAEIIETRHRGSIHFRWDIADATRDVKLPRLLLQPLVENAIKHGALRRRDGGEVAVRTELAADRKVTCVVEDNGPGPSEPRDGALGLTLVTRRLELELPGRAAFRLERTDGRTRSIVELDGAP